MTRLRDHPDDLAALVSRASDLLRLPLADVEKDFWVTELLRSVARPIDGGICIFKGGTSLSKAYSIIERFSEDVDILVAPTDNASAGARDRLLKGVAERAAVDLGLSGQLVASTKGVKRNITYEYPASYPDPGRLSAGVLLEMGVRGGPEPHEPRVVESYVAIGAKGEGISPDEFDEFAPVSVLTLRPERTLAEKLSLLHDRASRLAANPDGLVGQGRHIYDVYRLLQADTVHDAIAIPGVVAALATDAELHSGRHGFPSTPRPTDGFAASPVWAAGDVRAKLNAAYSTASGLIWGTLPTLDECIAAVLDSRDLL
ncbi:MAG: nucleotidyl transferase AbiEii/AbiGii toxin family protein [Candidatus Limnocylindrales bacterium]